MDCLQLLLRTSLSASILSFCSDQPIHLYDAYLGSVRASYRPCNALDELESPTVATFSPDGQRLFATGFRTDRSIHVFDIARPGRDSTVLHLGKTRRSSDGQKGLVSALASTTDSRVFAVGTYSPGSIYVYDDRTGQQPTGTILNGLCVVGHGRSHSRRKRRFVVEPATDSIDEETDWLSSAKIKWFLTRAQSGITQMLFASDQQYTLYSASRRSDSILSWDLRMLSANSEYQSHPIRGLASFSTKNDTNQRLEFDLDETGRRIFVGGRDQCVRIYDVQSSKLIGSIQNLDDASNGVSHAKLLQTDKLAVATGARRFPEQNEIDESDDSCQKCEPAPGFLRLYNLKTLAQ